MKPARRLNALRFSLSLLTLFSLIVFAPRADFAQDTSVSQMPVSLALVFDLSQSTALALSRQTPTIKPKEFEKLLSPLFLTGSRNQYFIISVSTDPKVILDGSTDGKATLKALSKLGSMRREGATALYDACFLAINKVTRAEPSKRVLVVVSDGVDTLSKRTLNEVKRALVDSKVKLYAIVSKSEDGVKVYEAGIKALDEMASISGGEVFRPQRSEDLNAVMEMLVAKIQQ
jgi:hypothetical protein